MRDWLVGMRFSHIHCTIEGNDRERTGLDRMPCENDTDHGEGITRWRMLPDDLHDDERLIRWA